jgi:deazaflavin-dependent oxidoreductase (nitroreductase family)
MGALYRDANPFHRAMRRMAATRPMSWLYARTLRQVDRFVYRVTGGRSTFTAQGAGLPVVMLTTTGARTGRQRTAPLVGIPDGSGVVVIGTNYAQSSFPAWAHNLRVNPRATVEVDDVVKDVRAREVKDESEREACWAKGAEIYPGFAQYRTRVKREVPIFRLEPIEPETPSTP